MQIAAIPDYRSRFEQALGQLGVGGDQRIMLAVSGGPDSLALLLLAAAWSTGRVAAATVDHQLRPGSADEAEFVGDVCKDLGVPHLILVPAEPISGNIQSSARAARYGLLLQAAITHGCALVATAHHADDQLETLMMRLARGSGVDGLASIRTQYGRVIRPLLGFSKSELEEICTAAGISPVRDPSNDNADFDRVAMRHWLGKSDHPFDTARINRTVRALGDAAEALQWAAADLAQRRVNRYADIIQCDSANLPHDLKRRLLQLCLLRIHPGLQPRGEAIDRLLSELGSGRTSMIGNILCKSGGEGGSDWQFSLAPPRQTDRKTS